MVVSPADGAACARTLEVETATKGAAIATNTPVSPREIIEAPRALAPDRRHRRAPARQVRRRPTTPVLHGSEDVPRSTNSPPEDRFYALGPGRAPRAPLRRRPGVPRRVPE